MSTDVFSCFWERDIYFFLYFIDSSLKIGEMRSFPFVGSGWKHAWKYSNQETMISCSNVKPKATPEATELPSFPVLVWPEAAELPSFPLLVCLFVCLLACLLVRLTAYLLVCFFICLFVSLVLSPQSPQFSLWSWSTIFKKKHRYPELHRVTVVIHCV